MHPGASIFLCALICSLAIQIALGMNSTHNMETTFFTYLYISSVSSASNGVHGIRIIGALLDKESQASTGLMRRFINRGTSDGARSEVEDVKKRENYGVGVPVFYPGSDAGDTCAEGVLWVPWQGSQALCCYLEMMSSLGPGADLTHGLLTYTLPIVSCTIYDRQVVFWYIIAQCNIYKHVCYTHHSDIQLLNS